jgi:hypothetical protein
MKSIAVLFAERAGRLASKCEATVRTLAVAVAIVLTGCATDAEIAAARQSAMDAWGDCVMREVARLDDGKSDPLSIAYGIAPACASLYQQVTQTMLIGMTTENSQAYMRRLTSDSELRMITTAILTYRASRARH